MWSGRPKGRTGRAGGWLLAAVLILALANLSLICPPWSLKGVVAQRAQCLANLKTIAATLHERKIPLDPDHLERIRSAIREADLSCPEGNEVRGRRAPYIAVVENGKCALTEEAGNHPARSQFLAGEVSAREFRVELR